MSASKKASYVSFVSVLRCYDSTWCFLFSKHTPRAHVAVLARRTPRFLVLYTQQQHTAPKHDKACFLSRYGCCCCWCVCFRSGVFHDPPRECSLSSARTSRPRDLCLPLRAIAPVLSVPRCLFTPEGEWAGGPPHLPGSAQHQAQELWTVPRRGAFRRVAYLLKPISCTYTRMFSDGHLFFVGCLRRGVTSPLRLDLLGVSMWRPSNSRGSTTHPLSADRTAVKQHRK